MTPSAPSRSLFVSIFIYLCILRGDTDGLPCHRLRGERKWLAGYKKHFFLSLFLHSVFFLLTFFTALFVSPPGHREGRPHISTSPLSTVSLSFPRNQAFPGRTGEKKHHSIFSFHDSVRLTSSLVCKLDRYWVPPIYNRKQSTLVLLI